MLKRKSPPFLLSLIALAMISLLVGCSPPHLPKKTAVTILGTVEALHHSALQARIVLTRGKHILEEIIPLDQNQFTAKLQVPIGKWELTVFIVDQTGLVHYQNSPKQVQIALDQSNLIEIALRPADGTLHVAIDLTDYAFRDSALRARIFLNDKIYEVIRASANSPFETTINVPPGSYEFKIELFTESFRVGDRLGPGIWDILHIEPDETLFITWTPPVEMLEISVEINPLLPAPTDLRLAHVEQGVLIRWDPLVEKELLGYVLLVQDKLEDQFELLTPTPLQTTYFTYNFDTLEEHPAQLRFVVAGVNKNGHSGYYSDPVAWP